MTEKGTRTQGNYCVKMWLKRRTLWATARVEGFPRQRLNVWYLLALAIGQALITKHPRGLEE